VLELTKSGGFTDRSPTEAPFCSDPGVYRSLIVGDVDNDGAPDVLATQIDGPARLFRNVVPQRGRWLGVRAVDPRWQRDAHGAIVELRSGPLRLRRTVSPAFSYLASNDPRVSFGLGTVATVDEVRVRWPDGFRERFAGLAMDRAHTLRRGDGQPLNPP